MERVKRGIDKVKGVLALTAGRGHSMVRGRGTSRNPVGPTP